MQKKQKLDHSKLENNGDYLDQADGLNIHLIHFSQNFNKRIIFKDKNQQGWKKQEIRQKQQNFEILKVDR